MPRHNAMQTACSQVARIDGGESSSIIRLLINLPSGTGYNRAQVQKTNLTNKLTAERRIRTEQGPKQCEHDQNRVLRREAMEKEVLVRETEGREVSIREMMGGEISYGDTMWNV